MTDYKTTGFKKKIYESWQEHVNENTDFDSVKNWLKYLAEREKDMEIEKRLKNLEDKIED